MLEFVPARIYPPEILTAMTSAFDDICQSNSDQISGHPELRRKLAVIILRHVDGGERDRMRLAGLAFNELAGVRRAASG